MLKEDGTAMIKYSLASFEKEKQFAQYAADLMMIVCRTQLNHTWRKYVHWPRMWPVWPNMIWQQLQYLETWLC